jgi:hypothetical protein
LRSNAKGAFFRHNTGSVMVAIAQPKSRKHQKIRDRLDGSDRTEQRERAWPTAKCGALSNRREPDVAVVRGAEETLEEESLWKQSKRHIAVGEEKNELLLSLKPTAMSCRDQQCSLSPCTSSSLYEVLWLVFLECAAGRAVSEMRRRSYAKRLLMPLFL